MKGDKNVGQKKMEQGFGHHNGAKHDQERYESEICASFCFSGKIVTRVDKDSVKVMEKSLEIQVAQLLIKSLQLDL